MCINRKYLLHAAINLWLALFISPTSGSVAQTPAQRRTTRPADVQAQLLNYYRQYPDRYILVDKHTWFLDANTHISYHSFTLRNSAGVAYGDIEVCFSFQSGDNRNKVTRTVKVAGAVAPYRTLPVRRLPVKGLSSDFDSVTANVAKATIYK